MYDNETLSLLFGTLWLHHSETSLLSISRIHITMPTPETLRAMIGITVADYLRSAVRAHKILNFSDKCHIQIGLRHGKSLSLSSQESLAFKFSEDFLQRMIITLL